MQLQNSNGSCTGNDNLKTFNDPSKLPLKSDSTCKFIFAAGQAIFKFCTTKKGKTFPVGETRENKMCVCETQKCPREWRIRNGISINNHAYIKGFEK
jgi:hypothetical protein